MTYAFGKYILDLERRELRCGAEFVDLEPQVFDLLAFLLRHRDRVIGKDDLLQAVWSGRIVSDSALATRINAARRAIGDDGARQQLIRTLPRKGFRFVADVSEAPDSASPPPLAAPPGKPSLAVLPFANLGPDPQQEHFADGTVEQILAALSHIGWLRVVARRASFAYRGQTVDAKRLGHELGARYLIDGSVRRNGDRMRVSVQVIEAETREQLWADWCEGAVGGEFELQDRVAAVVAAAIEPALEAAETGRAMRRPSEEPRNLYLRALPGCYSYGARPLQQARDLLDQAIERDPGFARALAAAAGCRQFLSATGWADDRERNRREAIELTHRALQAAGDDPAVLMEAARVLGHFTEDIDTAVAIIDQALALNPNQARAWYWSGWVRLFAGQPDCAVEHFERARRLSPSRRPYLTGIGVAHFLSRRYAAATESLITASHEAPGWPTTLRFLAAAYAHLGRFEKARATVSRLRAVTPAVAPTADCAGKLPFRNREQSALYLAGLDAAAAA